MKKRTAILVLLLGFFFLMGCGEPKIDGSSDEALKKSIAKVRKNLSPDELKQFEGAIMTLAFDGVNLFNVSTDPDTVLRGMRAKLNGKTAHEVIKEAQKITLERLEKERSEILGKIEELEKEKARSGQALEKLKAFVVERSLFYYNKGGFSGLITEPVIELAVKNNTLYAVSRVYFNGTLTSPGRSVPWVKEDFNYQIPGGLEPGESATWKLSPNMFEWDQAPKDRNDLILTVTVFRLDGSNGEPLFDSKGFSEFDGETLNDFRKRLGEINQKLNETNTNVTK